MSEKIGEGLKYRVYDEGERVRKEPKTKKGIMLSCLRKDPLGTFLLECGLRNYIDRLYRARENSIEAVKQKKEA